MFWNAGSSHLTVLIFFTLLYVILLKKKYGCAEKSDHYDRAVPSTEPNISAHYFNIPRGSSRTTASYNLQWKGQNPVLPGKTRVYPSRLEISRFWKGILGEILPLEECSHSEAAFKHGKCRWAGRWCWFCSTSLCDSRRRSAWVRVCMCVPGKKAETAGGWRNLHLTKQKHRPWNF